MQMQSHFTSTPWLMFEWLSNSTEKLASAQVPSQWPDTCTRIHYYRLLSKDSKKVFLGFWRKGDVCRSSYILLVGGWRKMAHLLHQTGLHKSKIKKWGNVSCLLSFPAKNKKEGKRKAGLDTVTYQGRKWQGWKPVIFVRDRSSCNCPPPFPLFLFLKQTLSEFEGYIVSVFCYHSILLWDFEMRCLQASQMCPFDISDTELEKKRSALYWNQRYPLYSEKERKKKSIEAFKV